jgi:hypothetical protein
LFKRWNTYDAQEKVSLENQLCEATGAPLPADYRLATAEWVNKSSNSYALLTGEVNNDDDYGVPIMVHVDMEITSTSWYLQTIMNQRLMSQNLWLEPW